MSTPFGNISEKAGRVVGWAEKKTRIFCGGLSKKIGLIAILKYFLLYLPIEGGCVCDCFTLIIKAKKPLWEYNRSRQEKKYTCLGKKSSRF